MADLACAPTAIVQHLYWWREFEPWRHFVGAKSNLYYEICHSLRNDEEYAGHKDYWIKRVNSFLEKTYRKLK